MIIDMHKWLQKDFTRSRKAVLGGNKNPKYSKRLTHIKRIMNKFAMNDRDSYSFSNVDQIDSYIKSSNNPLFSSPDVKITFVTPEELETLLKNFESYEIISNNSTKELESLLTPERDDK